MVNARFAGMRMTGVPRSAYEIVSRMVASAENEYRLVSPRLEPDSTPSLGVEQLGYVRQGHLWEQLELQSIVRKAGRNAVLYSPMTSGPLAVGRQVMTVHDLFPVEHPEWFSRTFSAWYKWLLPRLFRRVDRVVANSNYSKERILELYGLPESKVVVCPFGKDERFTPPSEEEVARFRTEQGLPERYVLFLGSLESRKNLATLVDAWKRITARKEGVELVIAGGAARPAVFNTSASGVRVINDPTVRLMGFFPDEQLPLLYGAAEAFALPSLAEGFGLPVLEAMACGTPVICSDNTALPEVVGGAARLVSAHEIEAWVEAIDSVLRDSDMQCRMSSSGLKRAAEFSWDDTARNVRKVLGSV